ncbi:MAG: sulfite exporter TauE/SafE family protein, partial [Pirellulales bacterium]|nr:sulfite exporter TauE/SafE family protein [Pirellulales bacterium]
MIELPLVFLGGAVGSPAHCIGMCGPFALALGSAAEDARTNVRRQVVYTLGRVFTYAVLGAVVGFAGARLSGLTPSFIRVPSLLAMVAGLLLIYQGLRSAGFLRKSAVAAGSSGCLAGTFFGSFLAAPGLLNAFLAGLFTGLLPCGWLYGMLALASSTASMWWAMVVMVVFG